MLIHPTSTEQNDFPAPAESEGSDERVVETMEEERKGARPQSKKSLERRCLVSKERLSPDEMIRFALSPDGVVTPDLAGNLPGRGAWVSADRASLQKAIDSKLFNRAFKCQLEVNEELIEWVCSLLNRSCLNHLNIARRCGECIIGFDKAMEASRKGNVCAYIHANNSGADSRSKLKNTLSNNALTIDKWDGETLSDNFGTENTVHVVLLESGIANKFIKEYRKLDALVV